MQNTVCSPRLLANGIYGLQFPSLQLQCFQHLAQSADNLLVRPITLSPWSFSTWQKGLQQWDIRAVGADASLSIDVSSPTYLNPDGSPLLNSWVVNGIVGMKDTCSRTADSLGSPLTLDQINPHGLVTQFKADPVSPLKEDRSDGDTDSLLKTPYFPLNVTIHNANTFIHSYEPPNSIPESNKWIQSKSQSSTADNLLQSLHPISASVTYEKSKKKAKDSSVGKATKWNTVDELAFFLLILQYNGTRYKQFAKKFPDKEIKSLNNKWQLEKKRAQKNMYLDWKTVIVSLLCRYLSIVDQKQDGIASGIRATLTTVLSNINPGELNTFNRGRHAMYSRALFKKVCKMLGDKQLKSLKIDPSRDLEG